MTLGPGTRLGPYEIVSSLGAGGMGEVYRARDGRLKREVALKILPESFATDPDRLARFEREAQVLASLNHPHIAAIYGLEEAPGEAGPQARALVMELVEGETLADWIARGPVPVDEALSIAKQIAEALESAHEHGIIHRDLKPANIKVTPNGDVKVLDFGLAKLSEPGLGARDSGLEGAKGAVSMSPTITSPMMTGVGVLLGTAAYMAPEQAKGRPADQRTDVWAFGCVLYEMLTGTRTFDGEDMVDVLGAVARLEPDWSALPSDVPEAVRLLLRRCLTKDRRQRLGAIAAAKFVLESGSELAPPAAPTLPARALGWRWRTLGLLSGAAVLIAGISGMVVWFTIRPAPIDQRTVRFEIAPPGNTPAEMFALSPDGRYLAFVANNSGPNQIWIRAMDALESRALAGTNDATYPFWSPDGAYLGFFAQGKLRKIAAAGGPPQTLCDAPNARGGTWNADGVILFSAGPASPILRVPAAGGVPAAITKVLDNDVGAGHRFPAFLPDGVHFLYNAGSNAPDFAGLFLGSLADGSSKRILQDQTNALYVPSTAQNPGHLVFRREDTLMAQPFDMRSLAFAGDMFPVVDRVPFSVNTGFGAFTVSTTGTLVYRPGNLFATRELLWMDRSGKRIATAAKPAAFQAFSPAISPDQRSIAVTITAATLADIWLLDTTRDLSSRFTFRPGVNRSPIWSPEGKRVAFAHQETTGYSFDLYTKSATGGDAEELLLKGGINTFTMDWSSDGQWIAYRQLGDKTGVDIWLLPMMGDRKPVPYLHTEADEDNPKFSPAIPGGTRWIAYQSNESGQNQIYVQSVPANGAKYQISSAGGTLPAWRGDGKELYYLSADRRVMAVPMTLGAAVTAGSAQPLFANPAIVGFNVSRDGQRLLINATVDGNAGAPPAIVIVNWAAGLKN